MQNLDQKISIAKSYTGQKADHIKNTKGAYRHNNASETVTLKDIRLSAFDKNRRLEEQKDLVFDANCCYDIIYGTDFLSKVDIKINSETCFMGWYTSILPLRDPFRLDNESFKDMEDVMFVQTEDELLVLGDNWLDSYATEISDAKYDRTDVKDVVK